MRKGASAKQTVSGVRQTISFPFPASIKNQFVYAMKWKSASVVQGLHASPAPQVRLQDGPRQAVRGGLREGLQGSQGKIYSDLKLHLFTDFFKLSEMYKMSLRISYLGHPYL